MDENKGGHNLRTW